MKKYHYYLLVLLAIVTIIRVVYEFNNQSDVKKITKQIEARQKVVHQKGAIKAEILKDSSELDSKFNEKLRNCEPVNLVLKDDTNYVIYGLKNGVCHFEKYKTSFNLSCGLPLDILEKYATSAGGVDSFVNEIDNDKKYCSIDIVNYSMAKKNISKKVKKSDKTNLKK